MTRTILRGLWAVVVAGGCLATSSAQADLVSVNLTNTDGPRQILAGETTGVLPDSAWHNLQLGGPTGTAADVGGSVIDVAWTASSVGRQNTARDASNPDGTDGFLALFEAGLLDSAPGTPSSVTLSDLSAYLSATGLPSYNVYAYFKSPITASPDGISINGVTVDPDATAISVNDSFVLAGNPESNYAVFTGLTADTFSITFDRVDRDALLVGFQVAAVPEASQVLMLGLITAGIGVTRWRRRR